MNKVQAPSAKVESGPSKPERMLDAAQTIIGRKGLRALKVRDVATAAGMSLGGVYLHFADLDALIVAVNRRTLRRLDAVLTAATGADPHATIRALADAYLAFAAHEPNLVRSMFEHRMGDNRPFPDDLLREVTDTFAHIAAPLSLLLPETSADEIAVIARTMFSAFHGIVTMGIEERIVAVPLPRPRGQVALFVDAFLGGLVDALKG